MEQKNGFQEVLADLLQKTIDKKIFWTFVNDNALRWIKDNTHVTIQKQRVVTNAHIVADNYILNIQYPLDTPMNTQISSGAENSYKAILVQLFNEAMKENKRLENEKKLAAIKKLLDGI